RANENVNGFIGLTIGDTGGAEGESQVWGTGTDMTTCIENEPANTADTCTTSDSIVVDQAYLNFNVGPVNVRAGRQDFSPAGDIFNLVMVETYDAFNFSANAGLADIYGVFIRHSENDMNVGGNDGDDNIYVLGSQFSPNENVDAGAFVVYRRDRATKDEIFWLGADGSFKAGPVDISAEAVLLTGERDTGVASSSIDYSGYAVAVEASANINQIGFGAVVAYASGDGDNNDNDSEAFMGIDPSFNVTDIYFDGGDEGNGGAAITGELGGSYVASPYVTVQPIDQLKLGARYAFMMFTDNVTGSGQNQISTEDFIGQEIDLNVNYEIVPQLDIALQAAWFLPDDGVSTVGDTLSEYMARFTYAFGTGSN
ncbi:MAG: alginate export family protein, partial [Thermodesulfobacteriota bacterium]